LIFLYDENLSPRLVQQHQPSRGAIHINQLKPSKSAVIKDDLIRKLSLNETFVLVTKDDDFVKSWVSRRVPEKLIFIYDDFQNLQTLINSYKKHIPLLEILTIEYDFIEFSNKGIRMPFEEELPYQN
jgi:predicted nuclease of predicted toxin-antitoxin system